MENFLLSFVFPLTHIKPFEVPCFWKCAMLIKLSHLTLRPNQLLIHNLDELSPLQQSLKANIMTYLLSSPPSGLTFCSMMREAWWWMGLKSESVNRNSKQPVNTNSGLNYCCTVKSKSLFWVRIHGKFLFLPSILQIFCSLQLLSLLFLQRHRISVITQNQKSTQKPTCWVKTPVGKLWQYLVNITYNHQLWSKQIIWPLSNLKYVFLC